MIPVGLAYLSLIVGVVVGFILGFEYGPGAQGMEAQRATTVKQGVVHDSPVREANAPNPPPIALPSEQPNDH